MRVLLDTNVLIWVLGGSSRIDPIKELLLHDETEVFISSVSWWEIAIKSGLSKLDLDVAQLRKSASSSGFQELPVLGIHVEYISKLPSLYRDPFDRMLVAQPIVEPMQLITSDPQLVEYTALVKLI